ncbi:hypothetical protein Tco_0628250, partial [Tanacetum coccineum]
VARYAEFFEKRLISQEISGRAVGLEEIQKEEDITPSEITSNIPQEVEGFEPPQPPQEEVIPIRRSERTRRAPNHLCLNVEVEEHSLGDLNEPTSYKAAMLDSESNKLIDSMNAEIQSMMDNMVWVLVDLPPGCKIVGSKWLFKKKTDMDGTDKTKITRKPLKTGKRGHENGRAHKKLEKWSSFSQKWSNSQRKSNLGQQSQPLEDKNPNDKVVISKVLISSPSSKATWKMGKQNGMIGFTLESLTDQTQMPHNGLPSWQSVLEELMSWGSGIHLGSLSSGYDGVLGVTKHGEYLGSKGMGGWIGCGSLGIWKLDTGWWIGIFCDWKNLAGVWDDSPEPWGSEKTWVGSVGGFPSGGSNGLSGGSTEELPGSKGGEHADLGGNLIPRRVLWELWKDWEIVWSQNAYMDKILKRYKMDNSKRGHIPMQERLDLNKSQGAQTPKEVNRMKNVPYASANPGELHWTAVKNILKYLRNTKDMFLVYGGNPSTELRVECYCNAGFEIDINDMKSLTGYVSF